VVMVAVRPALCRWVGWSLPRSQRAGLPVLALTADTACLLGQMMWALVCLFPAETLPHQETCCGNQHQWAIAERDRSVQDGSPHRLNCIALEAMVSYLAANVAVVVSVRYPAYSGGAALVLHLLWVVESSGGVGKKRTGELLFPYSPIKHDS